ncbi:hypothetical protein [Flavihumibacter petaseus]|uniref:Uncharacterized protein n=1 Tax=Flavihumibacter petaseus NBRC 106054 TaxID=1220578 RepID=A0A0E9N363_9BACT|nr:hypothetical protein [Flavihumibacter petaseus]GAO43800.1 hypothetical protein FPE01S_02_09060 [Flavihumibacter petaseus NBRC 106054]
MDTTQLSGWYRIDGRDLWTVYSMFVESGSDGFLKYAAKKESITHDWRDEDGLDVDLSQIFLKDRDITLNVAILAESESRFWEVYEAFLAHMMQPGQRRIEVTEFGDRSFNVFYKECNNFKRFTRIKDSNLIGCKFSIVFTENKPSISSNVYIVDDQGRYLIT